MRAFLGSILSYHFFCFPEDCVRSFVWLQGPIIVLARRQDRQPYFGRLPEMETELLPALTCADGLCGCLALPCPLSPRAFITFNQRAW